MLTTPLARAPARAAPRMALRGVPAISRRRWLTVVAGASLALAMPSLGPVDVAAEVDSEAEANAAVDLINAYRQEQGLSPLGRSPRLAAAALAHAEDMASHNLFSHASSDGTDAFERIRGFYPYDTWLGENIGAGYRSAAALVAAWQQSPYHNDNLLLGEFQVIGLALAINDEATYRWYWACDFGGQPDAD